jgi:hypothetical protein
MKRLNPFLIEAKNNVMFLEQIIVRLYSDKQEYIVKFPGNKSLF